MKRIDLSGRVIGCLKVLGIDDERTALERKRKEAGEIVHGKLYWKCRCQKCGEIRVVTSDNLLSGNTKGCDCERAERGRLLLSKANVAKLNGDHYEIVANNTGHLILVDIDDYERIKHIGWHETPYGYASGREPTLGKAVLLHRLLVFGTENMGCDLFVDHINRNRLDCRRANLRTCTAQQNAWNRTVSSNTLSGRLGVKYDDKTCEWAAHITYMGQVIQLGSYSTFEEAELARQAAERRYYGEFAPIT